MNDFESELKKQKPKGIPSHWRQQILAAAEREATIGNVTSNGGCPRPWRNLFWPSPGIWAGLAAAWMIILFLNVSSDLSSTTPSSNQVVNTAPSEGIEERRRLMAELLGPVSEPATTIPFVPRRRSEVVSEFRVV